MSDKAVIGTLRFLGISLTLLVGGVLPAAAQAPARTWLDKSLSPDRRADLLVEQMTLDEKIQLVHGSGMMGPMHIGPVDPLTAARSLGGAGFVPGVPRLGIPDIQMADAAVGVTLGAAHSRYSTALPSALADASTWDLKMAWEYGALIGRELRDQGYNMSLGGGVNITREPRNGRNFEYDGEDPILAGKLDGQLVKGLQAQGVIGDIKHYALNDQETGRNIVNVIAGKRVMRETACHRHSRRVPNPPRNPPRRGSGQAVPRPARNPQLVEHTTACSSRPLTPQVAPASAITLRNSLSYRIKDAVMRTPPAPARAIDAVFRSMR
jgi:Glycosyl hydrolase family 3 N terminal domain